MKKHLLFAFGTEVSAFSLSGLWHLPLFCLADAPRSAQIWDATRSAQIWKRNMCVNINSEALCRNNEELLTLWLWRWLVSIFLGCALTCASFFLGRSSLYYTDMKKNTNIQQLDYELEFSIRQLRLSAPDFYRVIVNGSPRQLSRIEIESE